MPYASEKLQSGRILNDAVLAAFRMQGMTLSGWCRKNGVYPTNARNVLLGVWNGPKGRVLLDRLIEVGGRERVEKLYRERMEIEVAKNQGDAA